MNLLEIDFFGPIGSRIFTNAVKRTDERMLKSYLQKTQWNDRCTFCGQIHFLHDTPRLDPWVRAVNN